MVDLNDAQIKGLAGVFFNLATGLILGGVAFTIVGPLSGKIFASLLTFVFSFVLIQLGLKLLKGVN